MLRHAFIILVASSALCAVDSVTIAADAPAVDFRKQVVPIFTKYCTGCHSADEANGELNLASHTSLMRGGENGAVIVPGKPEKSRLILSLEKKIEPDRNRPRIFSPFGLGVLDLAVGNFVLEAATASGEGIALPDFFSNSTRW